MKLRDILGDLEILEQTAPPETEIGGVCRATSSSPSPASRATATASSPPP